MRNAPRRGRRSRADPRQNPVIHRCRLLDVQEVAGALDNLHSRSGREVTPGVLHEGRVDAAVTVPVQVQSRLRPGASQRLLFSRIRATRGEVAEPWLIGPVIANRRREVAVAAQALLDVPEIFARIVARGPVLPQPAKKRHVPSSEHRLGQGCLQEEQVEKPLQLIVTPSSSAARLALYSERIFLEYVEQVGLNTCGR